MTEPLTPPDCDLRDFSFMPLDAGRLFGSEFHAIANDSEWRAGVCLWLKSWHQVPAASLPNDDTMLCRLAEYGRDIRTWRKVRDVALRGWVLCSDGRLYHETVAQKAVEAWERKQAFRKRTEKARQARLGRRDDDNNASVTPSVTETVDASVTATTGTGTGTGTKKESTRDARLADEIIDRVWSDAPPKARERSSKADVRRTLAAAVKRGGAVDEIIRALKAYWRSEDASKSDGAFAKGIHRMIEGDRWRDWASVPAGSAVNPVDAPVNWAWRMEQWRASRMWLGAWGPTPNEQRCLCPADLLEGK
jgi:hypothetical protein